MRIGYLTNGTSCEIRMQEVLKEWLAKKDLLFIDEMYISNVSRRPDFLVYKEKNGLINIEAKSNNLDKLLIQMDDNSIYCDYSFAFIPDYCNTPEWFKKKLLESKYGLIIYNYDNETITEVLEAHKNKNILKELKIHVIDKMKKELIKRKKSKEIDIQKKLF